MGNFEKIAYHIFNLYRQQELDQALKQLDKNPALLPIPPKDWTKWKERVSNDLWGHIRMLHALPVAIAMLPVLREKFPEITPKDPPKITVKTPGYYPRLNIPGQNRDKSLPRLRPIFSDENHIESGH